MGRKRSKLALCRVFGDKGHPELHRPGLYYCINRGDTGRIDVAGVVRCFVGNDAPITPDVRGVRHQRSSDLHGGAGGQASLIEGGVSGRNQNQ